MSDGNVIQLPDPDISFDLDRLSPKPSPPPTKAPSATTLATTGSTSTSATTISTSKSTSAATTTTTTTAAQEPDLDAPSSQRSNYYSCPAPPADVITAKDDRGESISIEIPPPISTVAVQFDFELQLLQANLSSNSNLNSSNSNFKSNSDVDEDSNEDDKPSNPQSRRTSRRDELRQKLEVDYIDSTILPEIQQRVGRAVATVLRQHTENGDDEAACAGYFVDEWRVRRRLSTMATNRRRGTPTKTRQYSNRSSSRRLISDPGSPTRTKIIALSTSPSFPYYTLTVDGAYDGNVDESPSSSSNTTTPPASAFPQQCSPPYEGCYVIRGQMEVTYVGYNEASVASEIMHLVRDEMETVDEGTNEGSTGQGGDNSVDGIADDSRSGNNNNNDNNNNNNNDNNNITMTSLYQLKYLGPSSDDGHVRTANTPSAIISTMGQISSVIPESDGGISIVGIGIMVVLAATFLVALYAVFINDERVDVDEVVEKVKDKSTRVLAKSSKTKKSRKTRKSRKGMDKSQPLGDVEGDFDSDYDVEEEEEDDEEDDEEEGDHPGVPQSRDLHVNNRDDASTISHSFDLEAVTDWRSTQKKDGISSPTRSKSQVATAATTIAIASLSQAESSFQQQQQQPRPIPSSTSLKIKNIRAGTPDSEAPSYSANSSDAIQGMRSPSMAMAAIHAGASVSGESVRTTRSANEHEKATPVRANRASVAGRSLRIQPVALVDRTPSVTPSSAGSGNHTSLQQQHTHPHHPHHSSPYNSKLNAAAAMIIDPSPVSSSGNSIGSLGSRLQTVPEANLPPPAHDTPHKSKMHYPVLSPSVVSIGSSSSGSQTGRGNGGAGRSSSSRFWKDFPREIDEDSTFEAIEVTEVVHHHFDGDEEMWEV